MTVKVGRKETMTVADLRKILATYDNDLPVFATWETVLAPITQNNFCLTDKDIPDNTLCLVIDVEDY